MEGIVEIEVLLFGALKNAGHGERLRVRLPEGATVGVLREELARCIDREIVAASAIADEAVILQAAHVVREGATLALLPPVGGG